MTNIKMRVRTYTVQAAQTDCVRESVSGPDDAVRLLRSVFAELDADREHFVILALDARNQACGVKVIATGTASACLVHPREVFHAAITLGAVSIVVAHNHPSGNVSPSREDEALTTRLKQAGEMLGIPVVDSLILAGDRARSIH